MVEPSPHLQNRLPYYVDNLLLKAERREVEQHLKTCAECQREFENILESRKATPKDADLAGLAIPYEGGATTPAAPPPPTKQEKRKSLRFIAWILALAAVCAAMLAIGLMKYRLPRLSPSRAGVPQLPAAEPAAPADERANEPNERRHEEESKTPEPEPQPEPTPPRSPDAETTLNEPVGGAPPAAKPNVSRPRPRTNPPEIVSKRVRRRSAAVPVENAPARQKPAVPILAAPKYTEEKPEASPLKEWKGTQSGIKKFRTLTVRTPQEWQKLWRDHTRGVDSPEPLPEIDFAEYMVVGVYAGQKHTPGAAIEILGTRHGDDSVSVYFREAEPRAGTPLEKAVQPFHLRVVPKSELRVVFKRF